jgi:glycerophosphoryl diester phosphodiesterase
MLQVASPRRDFLSSPCLLGAAVNNVVNDNVEALPSKSLRQTLALDNINNSNSTSHHRRPWVIGHRGSVYDELENTLAGFQHCVDIGVDAVELDVFLVAGNELIVFHGGGGDETPGDLSEYCLNQTTGRRSILDCTSLQEIQELQLNPNHPEFGCCSSKIITAQIPTLRQVLELLRDTQVVIKIELKSSSSSSSGDIVQPVLKLVQQLEMQHQCHYSSFHHHLLKQIRDLHPERHNDNNNGDTTSSSSHVYKTGMLFAHIIPDNFIELALICGATEIHLKYDTCTCRRIQAIHDAGMDSMAWFRGPVGMQNDTTTKYLDVGNEDDDMYRAVMDSGVRQLCVNRPQVLMQLLLCLLKEEEEEEERI